MVNCQQTTEIVCTRLQTLFTLLNIIDERLGEIELIRTEKVPLVYSYCVYIKTSMKITHYSMTGWYGVSQRAALSSSLMKVMITNGFLTFCRTTNLDIFNDVVIDVIRVCVLLNTCSDSPSSSSSDSESSSSSDSESSSSSDSDSSPSSDSESSSSSDSDSSPSSDSESSSSSDSESSSSSDSDSSSSLDSDAVCHLLYIL